MTDNEKLARWQGCNTKAVYIDYDGTHHINDITPDYLNDDSAAMSLLDTLVGKGYDCYVMTLQLYPTIWSCRVFNSTVWIERTNKTRREAVVAAVLGLIEKEAVMNEFGQQKTDNEKLARWQGWECINGDWVAPSGRCENLGMTANYLNDDAAAMSLLDTLVEKGYDPELYYGWGEGIGSWYFQVHCDHKYHIKPTRREAVVAAVLGLIEKEAGMNTDYDEGFKARLAKTQADDDDQFWLRQYAGLAMQGLLVGVDEPRYRNIAGMAVKQALALLEEVKEHEGEM